MKDLKSLKTYLISRFMQIVVITALAEAVIFYALNRTIFRGFMLYFFGTDDIAHISASEAGLALVLLLLGTLMSLLGLILPKNLWRAIELIVGSIDRFASGLFELPEGAADLADMSFGTKILFTASLVAAVALILLPYAVAAVHFSYLVVREFKQIEDAELAKRDEYERRRNLMLSDIAHDLRTPMTTIAGYAKALDDDLVSEDRRREIYAALQAKTARMNDLINLLFDYVKLDSEGYTLSRSTVDLCELTRECAAFLYQDIEDAGMELDIDVPDEPIYTEADRVQMSRVVTNLITNAIRHNSRGARIGVYMTRDSETVNLCICDTGDPIEGPVAEHIFEPFVTGDESRNSRGGSGLGLSIAHKIVSLHGFRIRLIQKPDMVSYPKVSSYSKMFMIRIPAEACHS